MSIERKLAWISLLVGLVALLPLFREAGLGWSVVFVLLLIVVGGYLIYSERRLTKTAITTLVLTKRVVIHDRDAKRSTLLRTQKMRVNSGWVSEMWFRNMVTDGSFGPVTIDGNPPSETTTMGCLASYCKKFKAPLSRGTVKQFTLECDVANSFPDEEEGLLHEVAQDTRLVILEVQLPVDRICKDALLLLEAGGEPARELQKPEISNDKRTIRSEIKAPHTGYTYHLHWTW